MENYWMVSWLTVDPVFIIKSPLTILCVLVLTSNLMLWEMFVLLFSFRLFHKTFLQDDAGKTDLAQRHGVCGKWASKSVAP